MGNKIGWIVAGVLVLALIGFVVYKASSPTLQPATSETSADMLEFHPLNVSPSLFLEAGPIGVGNAGDDYAKAIALYKANAPAIRDAVDKIDSLQNRSFVPKATTMTIMRQILEHVNAAGTKKDMKFTLVHTPKDFVVKGTYRPADDLSRVWRALCFLATVEFYANNYPAMEKILQAEFTLGYHMVNERARARAMWDGSVIQQTALNDLEKLYTNWEPEKHTKQVEGIRTYNRELDSFRVFIEKKYGTIWKNPPMPGDLYRIVEMDKDRAFRVDALLCLGVARFTHTKFPPDQKKIAALLEQFEKSSDPLEAAAAVAARKLNDDTVKEVTAPETDD